MFPGPKGIPDISSYDLAIEAHRLLRGDADIEVAGVSEELTEYPEAKVTTIEIRNETGAQQMGRPQGSYITIEVPQTEEAGLLIDEISEILAKHLKPLLPDVPSQQPFLVAGLGNQHATPDALGPQTIDFIQPTRHFFIHVPEAVDAGIHSLAAVSPGVMGATGIESAAIIRGVAEDIKPCCIIVVDALSAASISRVGTTIQLSDTGIRPGSGLDNARQALNAETMGVPVIAIGVPTVVHAKAIIRDTLRLFGEEFPFITQAATDDTLPKLTDKLLAAFDGELMVTPKEIDELIPHMAHTIAAGITQAVHPGANRENYHQYML